MQTSERLMTEHRLIELMLKHIHAELDRIAKTGKTDPLFVEGAVDFIRTYADRQTHRGKEDRDLGDKGFFDADNDAMDNPASRREVHVDCRTL